MQVAGLSGHLHRVCLIGGPYCRRRSTVASARVKSTASTLDHPAAAAIPEVIDRRLASGKAADDDAEQADQMSVHEVNIAAWPRRWPAASIRSQTVPPSIQNRRPNFDIRTPR